MAIFNNSIIPAAAAAADDVVTKSLRFDRASSSKLTRTFGTPTSQRRVTISWWMKLAEQGDGSTSYCAVISTGSDYQNYTAVKLDGGTTNPITFEEVAGGAYESNRSTSRAFRDMGAWVHCVHVIDTTDSTADDRSKLYINGARYEGPFGTSYATYTLNYDTNWSASGEEIGIGLDIATAGPYFGGYLADIHYIDGQALTPSSFAEEDATTGQWKPKAFVGVYGNNGFHLEFKETGTGTASSTTIGADTSVDTYLTATGGTVTTDGDYKIHTFNSTGTFEATNASSAPIEYLVVAGGAGGGGNGGGGGGAGGYLTATGLSVTEQSYTVTVGAGGAKGAHSGATGHEGANGTDSTISTVTSTGGGGGSGTYNSSDSSNNLGHSGGSGGGGGPFGSGGSAVSGQGYGGGSGTDSGGNRFGGGGGGGAGAVGGNSTNNGSSWGRGGDGGAGAASSITGSSVTRAGGGGGISGTSDYSSAGGVGGGGAGGFHVGGPPYVATAGTANTGSGGGGGGSYNSGDSAAGGSGCVILRYKFQ